MQKRCRIKQNNNKIKPKLKITNHIMIKGQKEQSEKILIKSIKSLQKDFPKNHIDIIHTAIINATPIFEIKERSLKQKKRKILVPSFLSNKRIRTSKSIKNMILKARKVKSNKPFYYEFKKELVLNAQKKSDLIKTNINNQKLVLTKKKYLDNYKWYGKKLNKNI